MQRHIWYLRAPFAFSHVKAYECLLCSTTSSSPGPYMIWDSNGYDATAIAKAISHDTSVSAVLPYLFRPKTVPRFIALQIRRQAQCNDGHADMMVRWYLHSDSSISTPITFLLPPLYSYILCSLIHVQLLR